MMYFWVMDRRMCRLILKTVLRNNSRCAECVHIYTKERQQGVIANAALQMTGHERVNPLTQGLVHHWVNCLVSSRDETGSH